MTCSQNEAGSIILPEQDVVFRNLKNAKRFAIDIGGALTKIAYYSTESYKRALYSIDEQTTELNNDNIEQEVAETDVEVARLHFIKFETKHIETCLSFIQQHLVGSPDFMRGKSIKATGGGAYKYTDLLSSTLGLTVDKEDEMECLIKGCNFILKNLPDEVFEYRRHVNPEYRFHSVDPNMYPYLLVNIGSGVSIMKVESESSYERIGGSAMGGGTFWGLGSLLTKAKVALYARAKDDGNDGCFQGHLTDDVKNLWGKQEHYWDIPGGQPLDICINKPFKDCIRKLRRLAYCQRS